MKYQLVADDEAEHQAINANPAARVLFEPLLPLIQIRCLMAGVRLGLFETIGNSKADPVELAGELGLDPDGLEMVLRILVNAGYLGVANGRYELTPLAVAHLLPGEPTSLRNWVAHNYLQWNVVADLEDLLTGGANNSPEQYLTGADDWVTYQEAMLETARPAAQAVAAAIPVKDGANRMLDIGGGHGLYGAALCRQHAPLTSVVLDLPQAVEHGRRLAVREGFDDIVTHRVGDALEPNIGDGYPYDVVFMGQVLHHFQPHQNAELLGRVATCLSPGGTVAIWDFKRPDPQAQPDLLGDGLALFFHISSAAGCYRTMDFVGWLEASGFEDITAQPVPVPAQILLTGRKPAR